MQYQKNHLCVCFLNIFLSWTGPNRTASGPDIDNVVHGPCQVFPSAAPTDTGQEVTVQFLTVLVPAVKDTGLLEELVGPVRQAPHSQGAVIPTARTFKKWEKGKVFFIYYKVFLMLRKQSLSYLEFITCTYFFLLISICRSIKHLK